MKTSFRTVAPVALTCLASFLAPMTVFAQDEPLERGQCRSDADCSEGDTCEKKVSVSGCSGSAPSPGGDAIAPPEEECDSEPVENEIGYCFTPPKTCSSDADCDEYMSCVTNSSGVCWADVEGNSGCSEPDPDAPKYCTVANKACSEDSDCPREFECVQDQAVCPAIACAEDDPDCKVDCDPPETKSCQPKSIPCEDDSACPSDWSCFGNEATSCSGGADMPTEPADPGSSSDPLPSEEVCTTEAAVGSCYPNSWSAGEGVVYASGAEDSSAPSSAGPGGKDGTDETTAESASAGGCSVSAQASPASAMSWLLVALSVAPLAFRRRRAIS